MILAVFSNFNHSKEEQRSKKWSQTPQILAHAELPPHSPPAHTGFPFPAQPCSNVGSVQGWFSAAPRGTVQRRAYRAATRCHWESHGRNRHKSLLLCTKSQIVYSGQKKHHGKNNNCTLSDSASLCSVATQREAGADSDWHGSTAFK